MFTRSRIQHNRVTIVDDKIDIDMCRDDAVDEIYLDFWYETELGALKTF